MLTGPMKIANQIQKLSKQDKINLFEWIERNHKWLYEYAQMCDGEKRFHRNRVDVKEKGLYYERETQ